MKNRLFLAFAFILGLSINNIAMSGITNKVAVIDVNKVAQSCSQVQTLKKEHEQKISALQTFANNANKAINAEADKNKKKALQDKYTKELNTKKKAIQDDYTKKLKIIDNNINYAIQKKAKDGNYDLVLSKQMVVYGGDDITEQVVSAVK